MLAGGPHLEELAEDCNGKHRWETRPPDERQRVLFVGPHSRDFDRAYVILLAHSKVGCLAECKSGDHGDNNETTYARHHDLKRCLLPHLN